MKPFDQQPPEGVKILTIILSVLLGVGAILSAYSIPAQRILFQPAPLLTALEKFSFSERLPKFMVNLVAAGGSFGILEDLPEEQTKAVAAAVFPPEYALQQTTILLTHLYQYLNFQSTTLTLPLDLAPVREQMRSDSAARAMVESWPDCGLEQALSVVTGGSLPVCRPPEALMPLAVELTRAALSQAAWLVPDQVDFAKLIDKSLDDQARRGLDQAFTIYRGLRIAALVLPWLAALCLLLIVILNWQYPRQLFLSLGLTFFISGIAAGIGGLVLLSVVDQLPMVQISWNGPAGGKDLLDVGLLSARMVLHSWALAGLAVSAGMAMAGGASGLLSRGVRL